MLSRFRRATCAAGAIPKQMPATDKLHAIRFRHPLDQAAPGAANVFDQGPLERPGDGTTVNATGGFPNQDIRSLGLIAQQARATVPEPLA